MHPIIVLWKLQCSGNSKRVCAHLEFSIDSYTDILQELLELFNIFFVTSFDCIWVVAMTINCFVEVHVKVLAKCPLPLLDVKVWHDSKSNAVWCHIVSNIGNLSCWHQKESVAQAMVQSKILQL